MWSASFQPIWTTWALALLMELGPHKDREKLWPGWELNPRPSSLITAALPTELQGQTGAHYNDIKSVFAETRANINYFWVSNVYDAKTREANSEVWVQMLIVILNLAHQFTTKFIKQFYNYLKSITRIFYSKLLLYFCKSEYRWFYRLYTMDTIVTTDDSHKLAFLNETVSKDEASNPGKECEVFHCKAIDGKITLYLR